MSEKLPHVTMYVIVIFVVKNWCECLASGVLTENTCDLEDDLRVHQISFAVK